MARTYPRTRAAMREHELSQWRLGDALLIECGAPGRMASTTAPVLDWPKPPNCSSRTVSSIINSRPYEYAGDTSSLYPAGTRIPGVGWSIHRIVGDPELLVCILENLPADQRS